MQALRFDPVPRGAGQATPRPQPAAKAAEPESTTLGNLADRLEEALAEEVQAVTHGSSPALDLESDEFGFGERPAARNSRAGRQDEPRARSAKAEPPRAPEPKTPAPEPEKRRDAAASGERVERSERTERREEAPVISLNARRRESSDALEDEMARLLGELTGDTKGR